MDRDARQAARRPSEPETLEQRRDGKAPAIPPGGSDRKRPSSVLFSATERAALRERPRPTTTGSAGNVPSPGSGGGTEWFKRFFRPETSKIISKVVGNLSWTDTGNRSCRRLWIYPYLSGLQYAFHVLLVGYPFTGFFALELFVWFQGFPSVRETQFVSLPVAAFIFAYLNEYPNTFAHEWKYVNWPIGEFLNVPILVPFLWVPLLFVLRF